MFTDITAKSLASAFEGRTLSGYLVIGYHSHGATSVVLSASKDDERYAIKVYSPHLFARSEQDSAAERERIERQLNIGKKPHENIVRTLAYGQSEDKSYHYIVMDFVSDPTLEELINEIPTEKIYEVLKQIAKGCLFLHEQGLVHRDIKPANIAVRRKDYFVTILDLGLLRPDSGDSISDQGNPRFLATKRYAPPEFIAGRVSKDKDGWKAVTIYQIGAVLYQIVMKRALFEGYEGDQLIYAIHNEKPDLGASSVPSELQQLTLDCLTKDPRLRLSLVDWHRFLDQEKGDESALASGKLFDAVQRLRQKQSSIISPQVVSDASAANLKMLDLERALDLTVRRFLSQWKNYLLRSEIETTRNDKIIHIELTTSIVAGTEFERICVAIDCHVIDLLTPVVRIEAKSSFAESIMVGVGPEVLYSGSFVDTLVDKKFSDGVTNQLQLLLSQLDTQ